MAEAALSQPNVQCGFCLREGNLDYPKSLPCSHVHCQACLVGDFRVNKILRCPWCRKVYDIPIDSLPSSDLEDDSLSCDVCKKKGKSNQPAVRYCTLCRKLLCGKHEESHDDVNEDHQKMTIPDYNRMQAKRLERRVCSQHAQFPYILRCRGCVKLFCVKCASGANLCDDGLVHQLINIDELVKELTTVDELLTEDDKLSTLHKQITKVVSDFDTETEDLLEMLHKQRDKQLAAVRLKYEVLEAEFLANRSEAKTDLTRYKEEEVGTLLSDLSKMRMKIESQLKQSHQVDVVQGHEDIRDRIQKQLSTEVPKLELCSVMSLQVTEEKRNIEVELVPTADISISLEEGMATSLVPVSFTLVHTVGVTSNCMSVCKYQDKEYVGLTGGGIDKIDRNYNSCSKSFVTSGSVDAVIVHKSLLYVLLRSSPWTVNVHDPHSRTLVTSWNHEDTNTGNTNKFAIVDDKVVVPNRSSKKLIIYSLTGEVLKCIPCPLISNDQTTICTADTDCVIVSDWKSSRVFKLDLTTERVIWTSTEVPKPQGVTCYRSRYVLVTHKSAGTTIWFLDVKSGRLISKLTDSADRGASNVYDLHVSGNTLTVVRCNKNKVLYYQLN